MKRLLIAVANVMKGDRKYCFSLQIRGCPNARQLGVLDAGAYIVFECQGSISASFRCAIIGLFGRVRCGF